MTLDQIHASLVELFRQIVAESPDEWNVYEHEWIAAIHAPCVIVGTVLEAEHETFRTPRYSFEVKLRVAPSEDANAVASLHRAIDLHTADSFVDRLRSLAAAASWGSFDLTEAGRIRTRQIAVERFAGIEAAIPITVIPTEES